MKYRFSMLVDTGAEWLTMDEATAMGQNMSAHVMEEKKSDIPGFTKVAVAPLVSVTWETDKEGG